MAQGRSLGFGTLYFKILFLNLNFNINLHCEFEFEFEFEVQLQSIDYFEND